MEMSPSGLAARRVSEFLFSSTVTTSSLPAPSSDLIPRHFLGGPAEMEISLAPSRYSRPSRSAVYRRVGQIEMKV